jgi:hypothetical protein
VLLTAAERTTQISAAGVGRSRQEFDAAAAAADAASAQVVTLTQSAL